MGIALFSACICVLTRAILNVCDRKIFKNSNTDFLKSIVYNSFFPFLLAISTAYLFGDKNQYFFTFILQPGVILSALAVQFTAYMFSYCFRKMTVKSIVISSKMADVFIPLFVFFITNEFKTTEYYYSFISTLLFIPILISLLKNNSEFYFMPSLTIILALIFQAVINSYFSMHSYANTWPKFLSLMSCILFWRSLFLLIPLCIQSMRSIQKDDESNAKKVAYFTLFIRAFLAFVSQASFFYSITRLSSNAAWPILNSTPLVACFTAHVFLKEKVGKVEIGVFMFFILLSIFYVFMHWS